MQRSIKACLSFACLFVCMPVPAIVQRVEPGVGEIVSARGEEEIRLVETTQWLDAEVLQRLVAGDALRTGPYGALSILFEDETQLRMHRNSLIIIKDIARTAEDTESSLRLEFGALWARATSVLRGLFTQRKIRVQTPSATAGIRGTDWYLEVNLDGRSLLTVLSGEAEFFNDQGSVIIRRGEIGEAEVGKAPVKRVIVDVQDRPLMVLEFRPRWFSSLTATGQDFQTVRAERDQLQAPLESLSSEALIGSAAIAHDLGDFADAERRLQAALTSNSQIVDDARYQLLQGLLAGQRREFARADASFAEAARTLAGSALVTARLGRIAVLLERREHLAAEAALRELMRAYPDDPGTALFEIALAFFRGEHGAAIERAEAAQARFSEDARFPANLAILYFIEGRSDATRDAFEHALSLDPEHPLALHAKGTYYHAVDPDAEQALTAYRASLASRPSSESWNNLGLVYADLGDFRAAESAYRSGLERDPQSSVVKANYAQLLIVLDRLAESEALYTEILSEQPGQPEALLGQALLSMNRGEIETAVRTALKAIANNPALPGAHSILAAAYYQQGRYPEALKTIRTAMRLDPNDPVAPLVASIMTQDRFEPGEAIRYGRAALDNARRFGSFAVESLANTRSGISSLGSAYASLGLNDWGIYYSTLAFDPYIANEYFFQGLRYTSTRARLGALTQGLLLDPTAVSAPARFYEFYRTPRADVSLSASVTGEESAHANSQSVTVQGFSRPNGPVSYAITASRAERDGPSINDESDSRSLLLGVGSRFGGRTHHLNFSASLFRDELGAPGSTTTPDPDDRQRFDSGSASLGYHRRFAFDNRLLAAIAFSKTSDQLVNGVPFGVGLSNTDYSLISVFGLQNARAFYDMGLFICTLDPPCPPDPNNPIFVTGEFGPLFGPEIANTLPVFLDLNPIIKESFHSKNFALQARHLLTVGDAEVTYGAEWFPSDIDLTTEFNDFQTVGVGEITDLVNFDFLFDFGTPAANLIRSAREPERTIIYAQSRWKHRPTFWTEAGVFVRDIDDKLVGLNETQADPRIGLAWQPGTDHWLRVALQRELVFVNSFGTLAPVATVGLVTQEDLFAEGGDLKELQARWDAEWSPGLFTFVALREGQLEREQALAGMVFRDESRLRALNAGVQTWFAERFGFALQGTRLSSEDRAGGANDGNDLPFLAESLASAALSWVHPYQITSSVIASYVGDRFADAANTTRLDSYTRTDFSISWFSAKRHWAMGLLLTNVSDERIELSPGVRLPQTALLRVEYRH